MSLSDRENVEEMIQTAIDAAYNLGFTDEEVKDILRQFLDGDNEDEMTAEMDENELPSCPHLHHKDCTAECPCYQPGQGGKMIFNGIVGPRLRPPLAPKTGDGHGN